MWAWGGERGGGWMLACLRRPHSPAWLCRASSSSAATSALNHSNFIVEGGIDLGKDRLAVQRLREAAD